MQTLLMTCIIGLFAFAGLVVVLLSLPSSRLRDWLLSAFGIGGAAVSAAAVVSPLDLLPGLPIDDLAYLVMALVFGAIAYMYRHARGDGDDPLTLPVKHLTPKEKRHG
jgi:hypothetical protein